MIDYLCYVRLRNLQDFYEGCIVFLLTVSFAAGVMPATFSVVNYGAKGDGTTDDSNAFQDAWGAACAETGTPTVLVPGGKTFLLKSQVTFSGPCKAFVNVQIDGNIVAANKVWSKNAEYWIGFVHTTGLSISGSGQIDGQGSIWWECRRSKQCTSSQVPNMLYLFGCDNFKLSGLKFVNSPQKHIVIHEISGGEVNGVTVSTPGDSPNTDGIYLMESRQITITSSRIGTGDDCIAMGTGTSNVNITYVNCGPGHGISIGSLGENGSPAMVEQIHVSHCNFYQTMNGVRIKTWQGGSGYVRGITFETIKFTAVDNPIIIDQYYCNGAHNCPNKTSAVEVSDVQYSQLTGTAGGELAINLRCCQSKGCRGVSMGGVYLQPANPTAKAGSFCFNVQGKKTGAVVPAVACLS